MDTSQVRSGQSPQQEDAGNVLAVAAHAAAEWLRRPVAQPSPSYVIHRGDIQVAQAHLQEFGFDLGPTDGLYTAQTQAAVRAYQARYSLPVTGLLDFDTRLQLILGLDYQGPNQ